METDSLGNVKEHEFHACNLTYKEDFIYLDLAFQLLIFCDSHIPMNTDT